MYVCSEIRQSPLMASIVLLNPPSPVDALANREGTASYGTLSQGFVYPPHTLAVIAAACRAAGLNSAVLDAVGERLDLPACVERLRAVQPSLLGVYCSWGTLDADRENVSALRAAFPRLPIIAIGTGIRYSGDELLVAGASHVLLGDPELAFAALAANPLPAPGIVRVRDILPDRHTRAGLVRDPADLPRPAWDSVPWQSYDFLTAFGSRGCDDTCKFCAYVVAQGRSFRPRPAADVADEMVWLADTFHPKRIMVRDPVFAYDRTRAMQIAQRLAERHYATPWECESRPEHFDDALLKQMALAGCRVIKIGVETADPDLLAAIGRVGNAAEAAPYLAYTKRVVAQARHYGIRTRVFVMTGLPGQTLAQAEATADYLRQLEPTFIHARPYIAYPRVPLGETETMERSEQLLAPLLAVAREREAVASQPPGLLSRIRNRLGR